MDRRGRLHRIAPGPHSRRPAGPALPRPLHLFPHLSRQHRDPARAARRPGRRAGGLWRGVRGRGVVGGGMCKEIESARSWSPGPRSLRPWAASVSRVLEARWNAMVLRIAINHKKKCTPFAPLNTHNNLRSCKFTIYIPRHNCTKTGHNYDHPKNQRMKTDSPP